VMVTLWATPAVVLEGKPVSAIVLAAAGLTRMLPSVPAIVDVCVSAAVTDCIPAVLNVALKACTPASAAGEGDVEFWSGAAFPVAASMIVAARSVVLNRTVPV